jgi:hypothetical protein
MSKARFQEDKYKLFGADDAIKDYKVKKNTSKNTFEPRFNQLSAAEMKAKQTYGRIIETNQPRLKTGETLIS